MVVHAETARPAQGLTRAAGQRRNRIPARRKAATLRLVNVILASSAATLAAILLTVAVLYSTSPFPAPIDAISRDPRPLVQKLGKADICVHGNDFTWISTGIVFSSTLRVVYVPVGAGFAPAPFAEKSIWIGDPRGRGFKVFSNSAATM